MLLTLFQALQIVSVDVPTACHLGICIAVRISEAVPLVNSILNTDLKFSISSLQTALKISGLGKRSKQRFLKASSKCFIIDQSKIPDEVVELLRKGIT